MTTPDPARTYTLLEPLDAEEKRMLFGVKEFVIRPALPLYWVEQPQQSLAKRLIRTLLRLPKPQPRPVYPEGTKAFLLVPEGGGKPTYIPHGLLEKA